MLEINGGFGLRHRLSGRQSLNKPKRASVRSTSSSTQSVAVPVSAAGLQAKLPAADDEVDGVSHKMRVNCAFVRRAWRLVKLAFPSFFSKPVGVLIVAILVNLASAFLIVRISFVAGPIYHELASGDPGAGLALVAVALVVFILLSLLEAWANW